jgi:hypothetical protein
MNSDFKNNDKHSSVAAQNSPTKRTTREFSPENGHVAPKKSRKSTSDKGSRDGSKKGEKHNTPPSKQSGGTTPVVPATELTEVLDKLNALQLLVQTQNKKIEELEKLNSGSVATSSSIPPFRPVERPSEAIPCSETLPFWVTGTHTAMTLTDTPSPKTIKPLLAAYKECNLESWRVTFLPFDYEPSLKVYLSRLDVVNAGSVKYRKDLPSSEKMVFKSRAGGYLKGLSSRDKSYQKSVFPRNVIFVDVEQPEYSYPYLLGEVKVDWIIRCYDKIEGQPADNTSTVPETKKEEIALPSKVAKKNLSSKMEEVATTTSTTSVTPMTGISTTITTKSVTVGPQTTYPTTGELHLFE